MSSSSASSLLLVGARGWAIAAGRALGSRVGWLGGAPALLLAGRERVTAVLGAQVVWRRRKAGLPAEEWEEVPPAHDPELLRRQVGGVHDPVEDQAAREEASPPDRQEREEIGHGRGRRRRRVVGVGARARHPHLDELEQRGCQRKGRDG